MFHEQKLPRKKRKIMIVTIISLSQFNNFTENLGLKTGSLGLHDMDNVFKK